MKYIEIGTLVIAVRKSFNQAVTRVMAFLLGVAMLTGVELAIAEDHSADSIPQKTHKVYFTLADDLGTPQLDAKTDFDCSDQIHTVVEISNYSKGKHLITVFWKDPSEETREKTEYQFNVHGEETRLWAWLNLSRAAGAGLIQWIDPAAGLESFIGVWTVEVLIDGDKISQQQFEVSC
jgi:hypothetical protein